MKSYTIAGAMCILAGIAFYAIGGLVLQKSLEVRNVNAEAFKTAESACKKQALALGGKIDAEAGTILRVDFDDIADPRRALEDATALLAMCQYRVISDACLGVGCGSTGPTPSNTVRMTIKLSEAKK
jgi:hypothetical protein